MEQNKLALWDNLAASPEGLEKLGMTVAKSGLIGLSKTEQGATLLVICMTERISILQFDRTYHILPNGKISKKAHAAQVEFENLGGVFDWKEIGDRHFDKEEERYAECFFKFKNRELLYRYSIADAIKEGIYKPGSRWTKRPGSMLRARVETNALNIICPQIFAGTEDDGEGVNAPELKLEPKPVVSVSSSPSSEPAAGKVIDIKAEIKAAETQPESEKELAAACLAPEPFKAEARDGKITALTVRALEKAMGEKRDDAVKELERRKWFIGGDIRTMTIGRAQRILDNPAQFLKAIGL